MNLVCIRHPQYQGKGSPDLTCKTCCSLYISIVKTRNSTNSAANTSNLTTPNKTPDETAWLKQKKSELEKMRSAMRQGQAKFHPGTI